MKMSEQIDSHDENKSFIIKGKTRVFEDCYGAFII